MIKTRINNEYKDIIKIFGGGTLQKEITKVWSREANKYVYESEVEYTGTLPITITADGSALLDYCIYGNTVQDGSPTPENPVDVVGCGVRTENIMDVYSAYGAKTAIVGGLNFDILETPQCITVNGQSNSVYPQIQIWGENGALQLENGKTYTASIRTTNAPEESNVYMIVAGLDAENNWTNIKYIYSNMGAASFSVLEDYVNYRYIVVCQNLGITYDDMKIYLMIAEGSTPPETYIPYGYKLPMVSRTENLWDPNTPFTEDKFIYQSGNLGTDTGWRASDYVGIDSNEQYTFSVNTTSAPATYHAFYDSNMRFISSIHAGTQTFTTSNDAAYARFSYRKTTTEIMLVKSSTPPDTYIPYGYKLSPIYLGEVETTRKIRKLVLTGEETFYKNNTSESTNYLYYAMRSVLLSGSINKTPVLCNELPTTRVPPQQQIGVSTDNGFSVVYFNFGADVMNAQPSGNTFDGLKEYLAAQYAAGTPVTVWYVLAEPETGIVNEPLMKIGNYADTLSMEQTDVSIPTFAGTTVIDYDGTPKPSEMYIKYRR